MIEQHDRARGSRGSAARRRNRAGRWARSVALALAACGVVAGPGPLRADEPEAPKTGGGAGQGPNFAVGPDGVETWYAQAMGRGESGAVVSHFWSKGDRFRAEIVVGGHRIVTIVNGEYYYTLDELTGQGVGIRRSPGAIREDATRSRPFGNELEELLAAGGERIKSDRVAGRPCELYRVTDESGRRSVCADPERGLPLQVERYDRSKGQTEVLNYLAWIGGIAIPDRFFEPDPRFALERLSLEEYSTRSRRELVGPAPPLYGSLLFGKRGHR